MKKRLIALVFVSIGSLAACGGSDAPVPEGNWDVTLTWTTTPAGEATCIFPSATFNINFNVARAGSVFTLTALEGLTGDQVGGSMLCDSVLCTLDFTDSGPGTEFSNIQNQTISATLDEDVNDIVTGSGTATFDLTDGSGCASNFDADGDVI
jgi:hypothetical protein